MYTVLISVINRILTGSLLVALATVLACTDGRPLKFTDSDLRDGLVRKNWVNDSIYTLKTTDQKAQWTSNPNLDWLAVNHQVFYKAQVLGAPSKLRVMFDELYVPAPSNSEYPLLLQVDRKGVTAYLLTSEISEFPVIQQQLSKVYKKDLSVRKIPIFYYKMGKYGVPVAKRNALEERLNMARLDTTNYYLENSSYIYLNLIERIPIGLIGNAKRDDERIFVADRMVNKVVSAGLLKKYRMRIGLPDTQEVVLKIQGNQLFVFEVADTSSGRVSKTDKNLIASGKETARIKNCSEVSSSVDLPPDCVLIGRYKFDVDRVEAHRNVMDYKGELGGQVVFRTDQSRQVVSLLEITEDQDPEYFKPDDSWDQRNLYRVKSLLDKEFYFKRTLQDYPGQVGIGLFRGAGGGLALVNFKLKEDRLNVVRADLSAMLPYSGELEKEVLLSFPAKFYKAAPTDNQGNDLTFPELKPTIYSDITDETYVEIDWKGSDVLDAESILSLFGGLGRGSCFASSGAKQVIQSDNRLEKDGVLNFTVEGTYTGNPDCFYGMGWAAYSNYWSTIDSNFNIKERFSLREVNPEDNVIKSFGIPEMAEKSFGYGSLTLPKRVYNEAGNAFRSHEIKYNPIIYDFYEGKPMKWYVQGIPKNFTFHQETVEAMEDVFADLNDKFRRAFKGTPLEAATAHMDHLFEYEIVPEGSQDVVVGDLDKNIIIVDPRPLSFGAFGVYWTLGSPNPRSGQAVHSNVTVFAGNMRSALERIRWAYNIKKKRIDEINEKLAQFAQINDVPVSLSLEDIRADQEDIRKDQEESLEAERQSDSLSSLLESFGKGTEGGDDETEQKDDGALHDNYVRVRPHVDVQGGPFFDLMKNLKKSFVLSREIRGVNGGNSTTYVHPLKSFPEILQSVRLHLKNISSSDEINISDFLERGMGTGLITKEQYSYTLLQRIVDRHAEGGKNMGGLMNEPIRFKAAFLEELLKAPSSMIPKRELREIFAEYTQLKGFVNFMDSNDSLGMAYCFDQFDQMSLGDYDILSKMSDGEIFKSLISNTTEHEILHAMGYSHQFKGSADHANHEFEGENTGRLSSSVLEYGSLTARASWRGMGPHDVHAGRAMYTGMVEVNPDVVEASGTKIAMKLRATGEIYEIPVYDGRLVRMDEFKEIVLQDRDWLDFREELIDQYGMFKKYEYCTNRDLPYDAFCMTNDRGTTSVEIVQNEIDNYETSYWVTHFSNKKVRSDLRSLINNYFYSIYAFSRIRRVQDSLWTMVLTKRDRKHKDDFLEATILSRNYLLSTIRNPERREENQDVVPFVNYVQFNQGSQVSSYDYVEYFVPKSTGSKSADGYFRFSRLGNYFEKMVAMDILTLRLAQFRPEDDLFVPHRFSYLDTEKFLFEIEDPMESPVIQTLYQTLGERLQPLVRFQGPGSNGADLLEIPLSLGQPITTPGLSFIAAKGGVLNAYTPTIEDSYNFGNHFRVLASQCSGLRSENQGYVLGVSYGLNNEKSQMTFYSHGDDTSLVSATLVNTAAATRGIFDEDSSLNQVSREYADKMLDVLVAQEEFATQKQDSSSVTAGGGIRHAIVEHDKAEADGIPSGQQLVDRSTRSVKDLIEAQTERETSQGEEENLVGSEEEVATLSVQEKGVHQKRLMAYPGFHRDKLTEFREKFIKEYTRTISVDIGTARGLARFVELAVITGFQGEISEVSSMARTANSQGDDVAPEFAEQVQAAIDSLLGDIEYLRYKSPMTFTLIGHLFAQAKEREVETLYGHSVEELASAFDQEKVVDNYKRVKANLDLMNKMRSLIDPNARNNSYCEGP